MTTNQAVVVDQKAPGKLIIQDIAMPQTLPSEALVRVSAISLNRGETRRSIQAEDGWRPGWDLAGVVEQAASDGELMAYKHDGFWQCMDTKRDRDYLEELYAKNQAPWRV